MGLIPASAPGKALPTLEKVLIEAGGAMYRGAIVEITATGTCQLLADDAGTPVPYGVCVSINDEAIAGGPDQVLPYFSDGNAAGLPVKYIATAVAGDYCMVCTDPDQRYLMRADATGAVVGDSYGLNTTTSGNTVSGISSVELDVGDTTATRVTVVAVPANNGDGKDVIVKLTDLQ